MNVEFKNKTNTAVKLRSWSEGSYTNAIVSETKRYPYIKDLGEVPPSPWYQGKLIGDSDATITRTEALRITRGGYVSQGLALDDNYYYVFNSSDRCVRINRETKEEELFTYTSGSLGHANSATYCYENRYIYVVKPGGSSDNSGIAIIDTSDMSYKGDIAYGDIKDHDGNSIVPLAIAYEPYNQQFYITGGVSINVYDLEFNNVKTGSLDTTDKGTSTGQGCGADEKYIYTIRSKVDGSSTKNQIRIHNMSDEYIKTITIGTSEPEDMAIDFKTGEYFVNYYATNTILIDKITVS